MREAGEGERGRTKAGAIRVRGGSKGVDVGREGRNEGGEMEERSEEGDVQKER